MPYRVILSRRAEDEFDTLPAHVRKRVARWINLLADDPRRPGVKKLEGHDDLYRVHASRDHVIVYTIRDREVIVLVFRIAPRKDVYRGL